MIADIKSNIIELEKRLDELRGYLDLPEKIKRLAELEHITAEPGFWDDNEDAQKILKERSCIGKIVDGWQGIKSSLEESSILLEMAEEEGDSDLLTEIEEDLAGLMESLEEIEFQRMLSGDHDAGNAIVTVHSGAGGTESQDWAEMLLRMYLRWCEKKGYKTEILDYQEGDEAGIKSVTFTANGEYPYGYLKAEIGVHRLVRISPFDSNKRRHTSFASVFVLPEIEEELEVEIDESDLRIDTYRASGAGGQHVNKTDSAIRITHLPSGEVVQCQNERSQHKNKATAMKLLKAKLYALKIKEQEEKMDEINADKKEIGWGSQIRSYVMHPYRMVKDLRTGVETGNVDAVMDGDLDRFMVGYLKGN
ncbi:MAG: peptide chain release factor 2 [bacterium]|nr:peptide chain release factor 2 [bacterium]